MSREQHRENPRGEIRANKVVEQVDSRIGKRNVELIRTPHFRFSGSHNSRNGSKVTCEVYSDPGFGKVPCASVREVLDVEGEEHSTNAHPANQLDIQSVEDVSIYGSSKRPLPRMIEHIPKRLVVFVR